MRILGATDSKELLKAGKRDVLKGTRARDSSEERESVKVRPGHPCIYQINTRVWLTEFSRTLGRPATLDDIPDSELDRLVQMGFDWVWFLSVWQTGPAGQRFLAPITNGAGNFRRPYRICERKISPVQGLPSPATQCTEIWEAMQHWRACVNGSANGA